jgi:hypothetical protein
MIFLSTISGDSGALPFKRKEGNKKSPSALYADSLLHSTNAAETEPCNGTGLLLASVLQSPNRPRTQDRVTEISRVKKFTSLHRSANSSDRRKPVDPANMTIALSRIGSSDRRVWNSAGVRTSGSRRRFAEQRTLLMGLKVIHSCRIPWVKIADIMLRIFDREAGASGSDSSHCSTATVFTSEGLSCPHRGVRYSWAAIVLKPRPRHARRPALTSNRQKQTGDS